jgi:hypothetical protein
MLRFTESDKCGFGSYKTGFGMLAEACVSIVIHILAQKPLG